MALAAYLEIAVKTDDIESGGGAWTSFRIIAVDTDYCVILLVLGE